MRYSFLILFSFAAFSQSHEFPTKTTKIIFGADSLWVGTENGLWQYKQDRWSHHTQAAQGNDRQLKKITALAIDPKTNILWVGKAGQYGEGIERRDGNKWITERIHRGDENKKIPGGYITDICPDSDGFLVTIKQERFWGIFSIGSGGTINFSFNATSYANLLPETNSTACTCNGDNCWVGTAGSGLFGFSVMGREVEHTGSEWGGVSLIGDFWDAFDNRYIQSLALDTQERLWVGLRGDDGFFTKTGGLVEYDIRTKHFRQLPIDLPYSDDIRTLAVSEDNHLWIGTATNLIKMNLDTRRVETLPEYTDVHDIYYDAATKTLYVAYEKKAKWFRL